MIKEMTVNEEQCLKLAREGFSTMTELADDMVRLKGISFTMAHKIVAKLAAVAAEKNIPCEHIAPQLVDDISMELFGKKLDFTGEELKRAIDPLENVKSRNILGGPSFEEIRRMLKDRCKRLMESRQRWEDKKAYQQKKIQDVKNIARQIMES
ncbi:Argininosuccinate lyase [bioreactor metagenome]|uniref:Argininosuccinate lyase n=1 Tax=bioreactor metagenome TaxID=1076179 RepID=A0A645CZI6_9ZZZZ